MTNVQYPAQQGIVYVRYKKGSMHATGGTITEVTDADGVWVLHTFLSNGFFEVLDLGAIGTASLWQQADGSIVKVAVQGSDEDALVYNAAGVQTLSVKTDDFNQYGYGSALLAGCAGYQGIWWLLTRDGTGFGTVAQGATPPWIDGPYETSALYIATSPSANGQILSTWQLDGDSSGGTFCTFPVPMLHPTRLGDDTFLLAKRIYTPSNMDVYRYSAEDGTVIQTYHNTAYVLQMTASARADRLWIMTGANDATAPNVRILSYGLESGNRLQTFVATNTTSWMAPAAISIVFRDSPHVWPTFGAPNQWKLYRFDMKPRTEERA